MQQTSHQFQTTQFCLGLFIFPSNTLAGLKSFLSGTQIKLSHMNLSSNHCSCRRDLGEGDENRKALSTVTMSSCTPGHPGQLNSGCEPLFRGLLFCQGCRAERITSMDSSLKAGEVQLKRSGSSQPFSSSQCLMAAPKTRRKGLLDNSAQETWLLCCILPAGILCIS